MNTQLLIHKAPGNRLHKVRVAARGDKTFVELRYDRWGGEMERNRFMSFLSRSKREYIVRENISGPC